MEFLRRIRFIVFSFAYWFGNFFVIHCQWFGTVIFVSGNFVQVVLFQVFLFQVFLCFFLMLQVWLSDFD